MLLEHSRLPSSRKVVYSGARVQWFISVDIRIASEIPVYTLDAIEY